MSERWPFRKCADKALPFDWSNAALVIHAKPDRYDANMWGVSVSVAVDRPAVYREVCYVKIERHRARSLCWIAIMFGKFLERPLLKRWEERSAAPKGDEPGNSHTSRMD